MLRYSLEVPSQRSFAQSTAMTAVIESLVSTMVVNQDILSISLAFFVPNDAKQDDVLQLKRQPVSAKVSVEDSLEFRTSNTMFHRGLALTTPKRAKRSRCLESAGSAPLIQERPQVGGNNVTFESL